MIVELKGLQFVNKGAELMLLAILQEVGGRLPDARFVMVPRKNSPFQQRAKLGIYQKISCPSSNGLDACRIFGRLLPERARSDFGLVREEEIDLVLDASGYTYGDCFKPDNIVNATAQFRRMRKNGAKVVLLPQAIGPFEKERHRNCFRRLVDNVDLIFPRDDLSLSYVVEVSGKKDSIIQAPDFTNLLKPKIEKKTAEYRDKICLIPNNKMLSKTSREEKAKYIPFIVKCIEYLQENGEDVFFLIHEGVSDMRLAENICAGLNQKPPIVKVADALLIKSIIGSSKGVISSRFHGLVSALSQGIPALATSWSHKYRMLFKDYGFEEGVMSVNPDDHYIEKCLGVFCNQEQYREIRVRIRERLPGMEAKTTVMWDRVFDLVM